MALALRSTIEQAFWVRHQNHAVETYPGKPHNEIRHDCVECQETILCDNNPCLARDYKGPLPWATATPERIRSIPPHNHATFKQGHLKIAVSVRPSYCDRGRYLVFMESTDHAKDVIDAADMFPRYYFTPEALVSEITAFIKARRAEATT